MTAALSSDRDRKFLRNEAHSDVAWTLDDNRLGPDARETGRLSVRGNTLCDRRRKIESPSGSKLLRKKDRERDRESESDWRKVKVKEKGPRPQLSVSTEARSVVASPPATPRDGTTPLAMGTVPGLPTPATSGKKRRRGLARGVSMRAEKLVKSLDSALDFVEGR